MKSGASPRWSNHWLGGRFLGKIGPTLDFYIYDEPKWATIVLRFAHGDRNDGYSRITLVWQQWVELVQSFDGNELRAAFELERSVVFEFIAKCP